MMRANYDETTESDDIATFTAARPINEGNSESESDNSPLIHSHEQEKGEKYFRGDTELKLSFHVTSFLCSIDFIVTLFCINYHYQKSMADFRRHDTFLVSWDFWGSQMSMR